MSADAEHADEARRLLSTGRSAGAEPPDVLVRVVARLLADCPDALAAMTPSRGRTAQTANKDLAHAQAVLSAVAEPDATDAADGGDGLRSWVVSAALLHHTAVEAPAASDSLHQDLQEYLEACHGLSRR